MTDYRTLSDWEKAKVDKKIAEEVEPGHHINKHNGFEWDEPQYTINSIHSGTHCAICFNSHYTCVCSHN